MPPAHAGAALHFQITRGVGGLTACLGWVRAEGWRMTKGTVALVLAVAWLTACTELGEGDAPAPDGGARDAGPLRDGSSGDADGATEDRDSGPCSRTSDARCEAPSDAGHEPGGPADDAGFDAGSNEEAAPDAGTDAAASSMDRLLKVEKSGDGEGTVLSVSPDDAINCDAACENDSASYPSGSMVSLVAFAEPGSDIGDWSVETCSGNTCELTLDAAQTVAIEFHKQGHLLTVSKGGDGTGTVSSSPAGIDCGASCEHSYAHGSMITLTATATGGSSFGGWSGACSGFGTTCVVDLDAAQSVSAAFDRDLFSLSVSPTGTGAGSVTSDVGAISCPPTCSDSYASDTLVTLSATPDATSTFTSWGGDCSGSASCEVTVSRAHSVTAAFTRNVRTLTVSKAGVGQGTVVSSPAGADGQVINCGASCNGDDQSYVIDTPVTLTAVPDGDSAFMGWSGACSGTGSCQVTMSIARSVTATFLHALGVDCDAANECALGYCVDGVCCQTACNGVCAQCSSAGTCTSVPADDPACPVIACSDQECVLASNISSNRCEALGVCKGFDDCAGTPEPFRTACGDSFGQCNGEGSCALAQVPCGADTCAASGDEFCCVDKSTGNSFCEVSCDFSQYFWMWCRGELDCNLGEICCLITNGANFTFGDCRAGSCPAGGVKLCESAGECANGQSCSWVAGIPMGFKSCH